MTTPAKRPPMPPPIRPQAPPPPGLWRRTPPAIFPPIMGLLGLGLAWRRAAGAFDASPAVGELILGAAVLLYAFAALAWLAKPLRRPGAAVEDLRILPGRAGLAAGSLCLLLTAAALVPHAPGVARVLLVAGLALHAGLAVLILRVLAAGPEEARAPTPVWHLTFVGFIIGALSAAPLGWPLLAGTLFWASGAVALALWGLSAVQLARRIPPAPLRPLLAIHLAPAALLTTVAGLTGMAGLAQVLALVTLAILLALLAAARWITAAGFSPLWGAFTFPLAATATALLATGGPFLWPGVAVLAAATLAIPPILFKVLQAWARGALAAKTNAATA
ncbi:tellurium resistance protein [Ruixingdingia sedimenti]|uniref:Tellurium resistance protein n=1 Tax=Ruixingdingia sedimenti TaxID=3073604 RepID=A0ABU1FDN9_9RHOB|nr:tellurium resistance protein [Xinfangfangia sp. LG-4]MDR5654579.1 tellurium resistance protein [Xinfangfangia sp. LG-4]